MKIKENRSLIMFIILNLVTCGIYSLVYIHKLAKDINVMCEGDGSHTRGLRAVIFFSLITIGIYGLVWQCKIATRLQENGPRYGLMFKSGGGAIFGWTIFGSLLCGIGPLVAFHKIAKNTNGIACEYNKRKH